MESLTRLIDFTLKTNVERNILVHEITVNNMDDIIILTNDRLIEGQSKISKQLEQLADYILYGKDVEDERSAVDKKEVVMEPKYSTYKKKKPESLDAILENPNCDERSFKVVAREVYTNPKPTIDKEKDADIPGMAELWDFIELFDVFLKKITGKLPWDEGEKEIHMSSYDLFKSRHWLIDLRKQQYVLKEGYKPVIRFKSVMRQSNRKIDWDSDSGYAKTCRGEGIVDWEWIVIRNHVLDLSDRTHIQGLINNYSRLKQDTYDDLQSDMKYILWMLEKIIDECGFSEVRRDIIMRKIDGQTNVQLHDYLHLTYGLDYSANYISTIFTHEICEKIAKRYRMSVEEWKMREKHEMWKICTRCKCKKLANDENFTKKKSSKDGLNTRCKVCEKEVRKENKK